MLWNVRILDLFQFTIDKERGQSSLSPSSTQVHHHHHHQKEIKKQENSSQKATLSNTQNPDKNSQYHKHKNPKFS